MIATLSATIIWLAQERLHEYEQSRIPGMKYQNLNSSIHAIMVEISNELMKVMKENNDNDYT